MSTTPAKALAPRTVDLLREGPAGCNCHGGRRGTAGGECCGDCLHRCSLTRERIALTVLAGMANSRWSEEDAYLHLCDPANVGGRFLQQLHARNAGRARQWLHRQYQDARTWVAHSPAHDPLEDCYQLVQLREQAERGKGLRKGQAGVTDRAVLRFLIDKGLQYSSVIVRVSHRQVSEHTCASLPTVHRSLARLREAGWLEVYEESAGFRAASYRLRLPDAGSLITEVPLSTGGKDTPVLNLPADVHPLFAAGGLGRGVQETFAQLPFRMHRVGRLTAVTVHKESPGTVRWRPEQGRVWPLARAPRDTRGRTAQEVAELSGKSVETARRHLRRMQQAHLAFQDRDGRWFRWLFDPDALARHLAVPDTPALLRERHDHDRDGFFEFLTTPKGAAIYKARITKHVTDHEVLYVNDQSQEVLRRRASYKAATA